MHRQPLLSTVSLFPFLSILVCMMGVLAFILVSIAVVSATNPKVILDQESLISVAKSPTIVECHGDRVVLHPDGLKVPLTKMEDEESPFMQLIQRLARSKDDEYLFFAIYPEGIECFKKGRNIAELRSVDLGFEPMLEGWQLNMDHSPRENANGKTTEKK